MAEDLNGYFSSVFTRKDISALPPDAKFQVAKSDYPFEWKEVTIKPLFKRVREISRGITYQ